jgi:alpha-amylase
MLLMVDVAINALASTTKDISDASLASASGGTLLFKKQADYHPSCNIQWNNHTSEQQW